MSGRLPFRAGMTALQLGGADVAKRPEERVESGFIRLTRDAGERGWVKLDNGKLFSLYGLTEALVFLKSKLRGRAAIA